MEPLDVLNITIDWTMVALMVLIAGGATYYTSNRLRGYSNVFVILLAIHAAGETCQGLHVGPLWARYHLHAVGSPAALLPLFFLLNLLGYLVFGWWKRQFRTQDDGLSRARWFMAASLMVSGGVALLSIVWEILDATVYRSYIISQGYSGEIDVGDIVAFALGYCFIVVNHIRLRRRVLRA